MFSTWFFFLLDPSSLQRKFKNQQQQKTISQAFHRNEITNCPTQLIINKSLA